jgi:hypothetical protein
MLGSKPGEFTTSLSTITINSGGRRRRSEDDAVMPNAAFAQPPIVETTALPCCLPHGGDESQSSILSAFSDNGHDTTASAVPHLEGSIARKGIISTETKIKLLVKER